MNTAAVPSAAPALPWKLSRQCTPLCPAWPLTTSWLSGRRTPITANAGVVEEELAVFVPLLVQAGVTSFHVTLANHSALENTIPPASHPEFKENGCFLKFCDEVRRYIPACRFAVWAA